MICAKLLLDACSLIDLVKVDRVELLPLLAGRAAVTDVVWDEVAGREVQRRFPDEVDKLVRARDQAYFGVEPTAEAIAERYLLLHSRRDNPTRSKGEDSVLALAGVEIDWVVVSSDRAAYSMLCRELGEARVLRFAALLDKGVQAGALSAELRTDILARLAAMGRARE